MGRPLTLLLIESLRGALSSSWPIFSRPLLHLAMESH